MACQNSNEDLIIMHNTYIAVVNCYANKRNKFDSLEHTVESPAFSTTPWVEKKRSRINRSNKQSLDC